MSPYDHPYRQAVAASWNGQRQLRRATAATSSLWVGGAAGAAAGIEWLGLTAGLGAFLGTLVMLGWLIAALQVGRRIARGWQGTSSLSEVRRHRPQAGLQDPAVAHDEFAVTVEDTGHLVTWRFRPLRATEHPGSGEIEVPGRPRYAASPAGEEVFDTLDTVRATEQLVASQSAAAAREAAAADAARRSFEERGAVAERAIETKGTAAALRRTTGQRPRRR